MTQWGYSQVAVTWAKRTRNGRHLKIPRQNCMTVRLGWTDCPPIHLSLICLLFVWQWGLGGQTVIHLSLICMTVRLGWTDCYTFVSYLYDSKAWVDWLPYIFLLSSGVSNVCHIACVWSTFLKLGLIPLADEIKWKLMSSPHFGTKAYSLLVCRYLANVWFCKTRTVYVVPVTVKLRPAIPQDSIANYRTILRVTPRRLSLFPLVVHQGRAVYPHPLPLTLGIAEPNPNGGCGLQECWFDKFVLLRWFDRYHACRESLTARLSHGPGFLGGGQKHLVAWALVEMPAFLTSSKKREKFKQMWSPQLIQFIIHPFVSFTYQRTD